MKAPLVRDAEAAKMIGIRPQTLRTWRTCGKGPPYYKIGTSVRYDPAAIREWLRKRKVGR